MRNLLEYPVTQAEKIAAMQAATEAWQHAQQQRYGNDQPVGDITAAALNAIMEDLAKHKATLQPG